MSEYLPDGQPQEPDFRELVERYYGVVRRPKAVEPMAGSVGSPWPVSPERRALQEDFMSALETWVAANDAAGLTQLPPAFLPEGAPVEPYLLDWRYALEWQPPETFES